MAKTLSKETLTLSSVRERIHYDPETGFFTWLSKSHPRMVGKRAGCPSGRGYRQVWILGVHLKEHHLVWFYMTGTWPPDQLDHINGEKSDNRYINLRCVNNLQNQAARNVATRGIWRDERRNTWRASVGSGSNRLHLGTFATAEAAKAAYNRAAKQRYGDLVIG